ncbi:hypothetical protein ABBQ32_002839 [Trebouxia sp. C0010 RCD-2024]
MHTSCKCECADYSLDPLSPDGMWAQPYLLHPCSKRLAQQLAAWVQLIELSQTYLAGCTRPDVVFGLIFQAPPPVMVLHNAGSCVTVIATMTASFGKGVRSVLNS